MLNSDSVLRLSVSELRQWIGETNLHTVPLALRDQFCLAIQPNIQFPEEALPWAEAFFAEELRFTAEQLEILHAAGADFFQEAGRHGTDYAAMTTALKNTCGAKGKGLFQPLRLALTGDFHGPELDKILQVMGAERAHARFQQAQRVAAQ